MQVQRARTRTHACPLPRRTLNGRSRPTQICTRRRWPSDTWGACERVREAVKRAQATISPCRSTRLVATLHTRRFTRDGREKNTPGACASPGRCPARAPAAPCAQRPRAARRRSCGARGSRPAGARGGLMGVTHTELSQRLATAAAPAQARACGRGRGGAEAEAARSGGSAAVHLAAHIHSPPVARCTPRTPRRAASCRPRTRARRCWSAPCSGTAAGPARVCSRAAPCACRPAA